jgi:hypothetical protein
VFISMLSQQAGQEETLTIFILADEAGKRLFHILTDLDVPPLAMVCLLPPIPLCYPLTIASWRDEQARKRPW